jgi:hypothetical protein
MEEPLWDVGKIKPQSPGWRQGEGYCTYAGAYQWASGCRRRRRRFTRHWISTTTRLTKSGTAEYEAFRRRDLADRHYVSLWADGIHFTIRLEDERLCAFALIGVRPDGSKEVVALGASGSQALRHACARPGDPRWCPRLLGRGHAKCGQSGRAALPGCTGSPTSSTSCRSACSRGPSRPCTRCCTPTRGPRASGRSAAAAEYGASPRRPWPHSPRIRSDCRPVRLSGGSLETPADDEPDRVYVHDGSVARARHQGAARAPPA